MVDPNKRPTGLTRDVGFQIGVRRTLPIHYMVALLLYSVLSPPPPQLTTREVNDSVAQALASATPPPAYSARVYQAIRPSLVFIRTEDPDAKGEVAHSVGSGVIIDDRGDILTSLHVVANASDIQLIFADGTQSSAQVLVKQPENDIAVLRASQPPAQLVPAILGNPNAMHVGDEAFVVGNPLGLYSSMSAGVISGFDRSFQPVNSNQKVHNLIQIDAAVNPGNSGGPLLNLQGQVKGYRRTGPSVGAIGRRAAGARPHPRRRRGEAALNEAFKRAGVDALSLSTEEDLVRAIVRFATLRQQRRR